jgi:hypothetical protein
MQLLNRTAWLLWIVGTALIIGSWIRVVSIPVGWAGFGIAVAGTVLSSVGQQRAGTSVARPPVRVLCTTCQLNDAKVCWRPERPNAKKCDDYLQVAVQPAKPSN